MEKIDEIELNKQTFLTRFQNRPLGLYGKILNLSLISTVLSLGQYGKKARFNILP